MKTKKTTKEKREERELKVAMADCKGEFGDLLDDSFLDEGVFIEDDEEVVFCYE